MDALTYEVTELLRQLISNACVNDGSDASGHESTSATLLAHYLDGSGLDIEMFEPLPGRASLVARLEGRRSDAPTLMLMGHTDVVPVNANRWRHDPFAAEVIDGELWGRGAIDMLNLTASMAVAIRHLADEGSTLDGGLVYLAVADEEALGRYGAGWLTDNARDAVSADYVITESGGIPLPAPGRTKLPVVVGEKGSYWCSLRVRGTPGHASQPLRTDNALVKAAEVVRRLSEYRSSAQIHDSWQRFVNSLELPAELAQPLLDPDRVWDTCQNLPMIGLARQAHACTHTTFAPTVMRAGTKTNVIPETADLEVDIRTLPGQTSEDVREMIDDALGDLADEVVITAHSDDPSSTSPLETPLWDSLQRMSSRFHPGSLNVPVLTVGATDARFFRRLGAVSYGFGMFSHRCSFDDYNEMFHGDNERVDLESLRLSTEMWMALAHDFLR